MTLWPIVTRTLCGVGMVVATMSVTFAAQQPGAAGAQAPAARAPAPVTPDLFFRESFRESRKQWEGPQPPAGEPVVAELVSNPSLELKLYGGSAKEIIFYSSRSANWLFNGMTTTPIAVTFRHKDSYVDLSGLAKIRWAIRTSGFHVMRPVVKLADGTWLIGDREDSSWGANFNEIEFSLANVRWLPLDIDRVVTKNFTNGQWIDHPDLTKVDEIGYADLTNGSGHGFGGWASLSSIAVYGTPVKR